MRTGLIPVDGLVDDLVTADGAALRYDALTPADIPIDRVQQARRLGPTRVVLDTNGTLIEAMAMYGRARYSEVPRYNDNPYAEHWSGKAL